MRYFKGKPILIFLAVLVALYIVIYVIPRVTGALQSSYTAEYGELKVADDVTGYVVRNEKVYFSTKGGVINRYIGEGKLVRKGTQIMELSETSDRSEEGKYSDIREKSKGVKTEDFVTEEEGIVSFYADGHESELTPDKMKDLTEDDLSPLTGDDLVKLRRDETGANDPVFKVCDRSRWYIVSFVPKEHKDRYQAGQRVSLSIDEGAELVGRVESCKTAGDKIKLIVSTDYFYKNFAKQRVCDLTVITSSARGLIIENTSITEKKDKPGVYVRQKTGEYEFVRISVIASDGERSVVARSHFFDDDGEPVETLRNYDEILRRP